MSKVILKLQITDQGNVPIYRLDPPIGLWDQELGMHKFLDCQYDAISDFQANCRSGRENMRTLPFLGNWVYAPRIFDCFIGVLDLVS